MCAGNTIIICAVMAHGARVAARMLPGTWMQAVQPCRGQFLLDLEAITGSAMTGVYQEPHCTGVLMVVCTCHHLVSMSAASGCMGPPLPHVSGQGYHLLAAAHGAPSYYQELLDVRRELEERGPYALLCSGSSSVLLGYCTLCHGTARCSP